MLYEKTLQDNICNIKNLDTNTLNINVYFNKYYYDKMNEDTNFNDYVLLSEYNLLPDEEVQLTLKEDGNYSLVLFDEINNITTTIDIRIYINYRLSMIKDYFISFCLNNSKYNNKIEPDNYPKNLQGILNEYISIESIINYAFLNNYFNDKFFTLYLENAYNHYRYLFIPDTLNQRQYLNYIGKYNTKYNLCNKIASIFIIGFYLTDIAINTDTKINKIYSINRIKRCINKFGLVYETLRDIYYTEAPIPPTVITLIPNPIGLNTATLLGTITPGSEAIIFIGFHYKTTSQTWREAINVSASGSTNISSQITGLQQTTSYNVRAYITTASGTVYGFVETFMTQTSETPTVITNTTNSITQTTATLNGEIIAGSEEILSQGFELKGLTLPSWSIYNSTLVGNNISNNITGLVPNTAYQYRAYATTASGTVYGTTQNFTTLAIVPPTVVTSPATEITSTSAILNGIVTQGSEPIIDKGFYWRASFSPNWSRVYVNQALHIFTLEKLITNTLYEFRAFANTATDVVYGESLNFTTLEGEFNIYYGSVDTIPTKEEVVSQESTTSLTFTTPEITENINFIAFPETLTLVSVENNSFPGDFWYDDKNDLYVDKKTMDIDGVEYNVYCMTTFMPIAVGAKVIFK